MCEVGECELERKQIMELEKTYQGKNQDGGAIAENEHWLLFDNGGGNGEWLNLKLVSKNKIPKKSTYYFGWNGDRFSNSRDLALLIEHRKDVHEWLLQELSQ